MTEQDTPGQAPAPHAKFRDDVARRAARKIRARRSARPNVWFSLGMIGLIGWSVAVPTLAGIALGVWIDHSWPGRVSWTLTLLFAGAALGCLNAWRWVGQESRGDASTRDDDVRVDGDNRAKREGG